MSPSRKVAPGGPVAVAVVAAGLDEVAVLADLGQPPAVRVVGVGQDVGGALQGLGAGGDVAGGAAVEVEGAGGATADRAVPGVELAVGGVDAGVGGRAQARRLEEAGRCVSRQAEITPKSRRPGDIESGRRARMASAALSALHLPKGLVPETNCLDVFRSSESGLVPWIIRGSAENDRVNLEDLLAHQVPRPAASRSASAHPTRTSLPRLSEKSGNRMQSGE